MTGVSLSWLAATVVALFLLVRVTPSGIKKALKEVISIEVFWGGAFLTCLLALVSLALWNWQDGLSLLFGSYYSLFTSLWQGLVSAVFGAFLWVLLSLWFFDKKNKTFIFMMLGYILLMVGLNYVPDLKLYALSHWNILGIDDEALELIASIFLGMAVAGLVMGYAWQKCRLRNAAKS